MVNLLNLDEYYFGGNDALKRIDEAMASIKVKVSKSDTVLVETLPEYKIIKTALCEVFGFDDILLDMGISGNVGEIYTMPMYMSIAQLANVAFSGSDYYGKNKYGVCFTPKAGMVPFIRFNPRVLTAVDISPREATAILIHEVGHNFFSNDKANSLFLIMAHFRNIFEYLVQVAAYNTVPDPYEIMMGILHPFLQSSSSNKMLIVINSFLARVPGLNVVLGFLAKLKQSISVAYNEVMSVLFAYSSLIYFPAYWSKQIAAMGVMTAFNIITFGWLDTVYLSYDNEKFSDNFATSYGYGPEIASGMAKFDRFQYGGGGSKTLNEMAKDDPTGNVSWALTFGTLPIMISTHALLDCHPATEARILDQIKMLKAELNKRDLKPETKKKIKADLEKLEKVEKDFFTSRPGETNSFKKWRQDSAAGTKSYGGDVREIVNSTKDYDWKQLSKALNMKETDKGLFTGLKK